MPVNRNKIRTQFIIRTHDESKPISIKYPDCAAQDHVSLSWLRLYYHDLPPGTIIRYPSGKSITTKQVDKLVDL